MWVSASPSRGAEQKFHRLGGYPAAMRCVICRHDDTKVVDSRTAEEGAAIRRRRECPECGHRFTTYERIDEVALMVAKTKGGRREALRSRNCLYLEILDLNDGIAEPHVLLCLTATAAESGHGLASA